MVRTSVAFSEAAAMSSRRASCVLTRLPFLEANEGFVGPFRFEEGKDPGVGAVRFGKERKDGVGGNREKIETGHVS